MSLSYFIRQHMHLDYVPVPATWMYKPHEELLLGTQGAQTDIYAFGSTVYTVGHSHSYHIESTDDMV